MTEQVRDIAGFEGLYQVTDAGRVLNLRTGREHKQRRDAEGYMLVNLWQPAPVSRYTTAKVHRLVALAFLGAPPDGAPWVDHRNGRRGENAVGNLRWSTPQANHLNRHAPSTGNAGEVGVCFRPGKSNPYQAHITLNGRQRSLGHFSTQAQASNARRAHVNEVQHG